MMKNNYFFAKKTRKIILLLGLFFICSSAYSEWVRLGDISFSGNIAHDVRVCFEINGKGYAGTGEGGGFRKDFWEYDPSTDVWTQKADFAGSARWFAAGFAISGKGYLGTGSNGTAPTSDFYEYDPTANQWNPIAPFGGGARSRAIDFSIGNKGYVGLGFSATGALNDLWEYDPLTDSWVQKSNFPGAARGSGFSFVIANIAYVGCGHNQNTFYQDVYSFDPQDTPGGSWSQVANFGGGNRRLSGAFVINDMGYVTTGDFPVQSAQRDLWKYNPISNKWLRKENFPGTARLSVDAFSLNDKGYVGGGYTFSTNTYFRDFYEYSESCDTVTANFNYSEDLTTALTLNFSADEVFDHTATYAWDFGDGNTSNNQNPTHTYNSPGIYNVCLAIGNACSNRTFCENISVQNPGTYTKKINASEKILVHPNPANDHVFLKIPFSDSEGGVVIKLFNMDGKEIKSQNSNSPALCLDISDLSAGVYYLNLYSCNYYKLHSEKIIIRR